MHIRLKRELGKTLIFVYSVKIIIDTVAKLGIQKGDLKYELLIIPVQS